MSIFNINIITLSIVVLIVIIDKLPETSACFASGICGGGGGCGKNLKNKIYFI